MQRPEEPLAPFTHPGCEQIFVLLQRCCELTNTEVQATGLFGSSIVVGCGSGPWDWLELPGNSFLGESTMLFPVSYR